MKILLVAGARPNFMQIASIIGTIDASEFVNLSDISCRDYLNRRDNVALASLSIGLPWDKRFRLTPNRLCLQQSALHCQHSF